MEFNEDLDEVEVTPTTVDVDAVKGLVLKLIELVRQKHTIDPDRIVVTGYSMGGMGVWHLTARHPEIFRAGIVVSGEPPAGATPGQWRVPLYVIHSRQDEVLPLAPAQDLTSRMKKAGLRVELRVVTGITHYQVDGFVEPLKAAVPWLKKIWKQGGKPVS